MKWMPLLLLPILTISCRSKPEVKFVSSEVYILEKEDNKYKIIKSSTGEDIDEAIKRAPNQIIGLTQGKMKEIKDKIIKQAAEIKRLKLNDSQ